MFTLTIRVARYVYKLDDGSEQVVDKHDVVLDFNISGMSWVSFNEDVAEHIKMVLADEATHAASQLDVAVTPTRHMITMPQSLQGSPNPVTRRMLAMALADEASQKPTPTMEDTTIAYDMASSSKARKLTPKRRKY